MNSNSAKAAYYANCTPARLDQIIASMAPLAEAGHAEAKGALFYASNARGAKILLGN